MGMSVEEGVKALGARVREVEPSGYTKVSALGVEEQRVNVIVDPIAAPRAIGDGFRVEASIVVWSASNVLRVPRSALVRAADPGTPVRWSVYVVRRGRVEQRGVRVGHAGAADAEVLDGLAEGDQVIVFPSDQIKTGARVAPRKA
jgi:HlyD family secretion protein